MKILIIKMSSLGDVIHTLPAISDLLQNFPHAEIDWVIEENFAEVASWHPGVKKVIPVGLRRLRKRFPLTFFLRKSWRDFKQMLQKNHYDYIVDAQGLLKSAVIARWAGGKRYGFAFGSARESWASLFYHQSYRVDKNCHAVIKLRKLFAEIFGYNYDSLPLVYGIKERTWPTVNIVSKSVLLLHGTTWKTKLWPIGHWQQLVQKLAKQNYTVYLPWGNAQEKQRAEKIAAISEHAHVLPRYNLAQLASVLLHVNYAVAVDTGLGHLAAALEVPCVSLYGPTAPAKTGTYGLNQQHQRSTLPCAPCFQEHCKISSAVGSSDFPPCMAALNIGKCSALLKEHR